MKTYASHATPKHVNPFDIKSVNYSYFETFLVRTTSHPPCKYYYVHCPNCCRYLQCYFEVIAQQEMFEETLDCGLLLRC